MIGLSREYDKLVEEVIAWMKEYAEDDDDPYVGGYISFLRTGGLVVHLNDFDCDPGQMAVFSSGRVIEDTSAVHVDLYIRQWTDIERNLSALQHAKRRAVEAAEMGLTLTVEVGYPGDSTEGVSPLRNYELLLPGGAQMKRPCLADMAKRTWPITEIFLNTEIIAVRREEYVLVSTAHDWLLTPIKERESDEAGCIRFWGSVDELMETMRDLLLQALHHLEFHPEATVRFGLPDRERGVQTTLVDCVRPWPTDTNFE